MAEDKPVTLESLPELLKDDVAVKVAGVDVDGQLRGKLMAKKKFLSIAQEGFGFCSVVFGWDMHDQTYFRELGVSNKENGYRDLIAVPDLSSFRRIPWENNVPFFLISFHDPDTSDTLYACPRSLLRRQVDKLQQEGYGAMAGSIGGGGLGAIALQRGYARNQLIVMYVAVILLVLLVQVLQTIGTKLATKTDKRITK